MLIGWLRWLRLLAGVSKQVSCAIEKIFVRIYMQDPLKTTIDSYDKTVDAYIENTDSLSVETPDSLGFNDRNKSRKHRRRKRRSWFKKKKKFTPVGCRSF